MQQDLVTAHEVEAILGVSRPTISRMARDGRLTPVRTIPLYLFDRADVERVAQERKEPAA